MRSHFLKSSLIFLYSNQCECGQSSTTLTPGCTSNESQGCCCQDHFVNGQGFTGSLLYVTSSLVTSVKGTQVCESRGGAEVQQECCCFTPTTLQESICHTSSHSNINPNHRSCLYEVVPVSNSFPPDIPASSRNQKTCWLVNYSEHRCGVGESVGSLRAYETRIGYREVCGNGINGIALSWHKFVGPDGLLLCHKEMKNMRMP